MGLMDILANALSKDTGNEQQQFDQVAKQVPNEVVAQGLAGAFRADETPAVGEMVGQLFGKSDQQQQAGMLNKVLAAVGPSIAANLAGGALGRVMAPGSHQITPEQASQLSPQQVRDVVEQAQEKNPGLVDELANFYAQHTSLINTLGAAALAIALAKIKAHMVNK